MKRVFYLFFISAFIFLGCEKIELFKEGNIKKEPLDFKPREVKCVECAMEVESKKDSAQAVLPNGRTYFFDDIGCLALWLKKQKDKDKIKLWVYTYDTKRYIDAKKAWYRLGEKTPMNYGFGAYEKMVNGAISFDKFLIKMYRGENFKNPAIRKKFLGE